MGLFRANRPEQETKGELYLLGSAVFNGLFPIVINVGVHWFPPIFFAGTSMLVAAIPPLLFLLAERPRLPRIPIPVIGDLVIVSLFNLVFPTLCIVIGTQMTSSINTALLLQAEMLFTFILCNVFLRESTTRAQVTGFIGIFLGTCIILYHGGLRFNAGELLIVLGTAFYPIGNIFSKRALKYVHTMGILFVRSLLAGVIMLLISLFAEHTNGAVSLLWSPSAWIILVQGIFVLFISKLFWYRGLKRLSVGRSVFIGSSAPVFSLIFAAAFLKEIPTLVQLAGFLVTIVGLFLLTAPEGRPSLVREDVV